MNHISILLLTISFTVSVLVGCTKTPSKNLKDWPASLQAAYKSGFLIGSALNEDIVSGVDVASQSIVLQQFNTITAENVMKAGLINPLLSVYNFTGCKSNDHRIGC